MRRLLLAALAVIGLTAAEPAPAPDEPLDDRRLELRAQALFDDVRCVVCQHEAIADSPAGIAADMRRLVREQIEAGRSDAEIRADLVRRYGDFVLFTPPVKSSTWLLWFGPPALLLVAGGALLAMTRGRRPDPEPLTPEEEFRLAEILAERRDPDAKPSDD